MLSAEEESAIRSYSGAGHRRVNAVLRGEEAGDARVRAQIRAIDRVLARHRTTEAIVLYRGIAGDVADFMRASGAREGTILSEPGFMSTSLDRHAAGIFASWPPGGVIFSIKVRAGMNAFALAPYSECPAEQEFLLPRATGIRLLSDMNGRFVPAEAV